MNVASGSSKGCHDVSAAATSRRTEQDTYSILLLAHELSRCLEVDTKVCEFVFVIFTRILDRIDVEWHSKAVNGQNDRLRFAVNEDLQYRVRGHTGN